MKNYQHLTYLHIIYLEYFYDDVCQAAKKIENALLKLHAFFEHEVCVCCIES